MVREFFYALSYSCGMNLHIKVLDGLNCHHIIEAMFKAAAKALDEATSVDERFPEFCPQKEACDGTAWKPPAGGCFVYFGQQFSWLNGYCF